MKFIGAMSSMITGALAIVCLFLTWVAYPVSQLNESGWDLVKQDINISGFVLFKIFAVVAFIVGIILILYGLFLILVDLKVVKIKSKLNFYIINNILLSLFVICALLAFIGIWTYTSDTMFNDSIGIGAWLMLIIPAVLCLLSWMCSRKQK